MAEIDKHTKTNSNTDSTGLSFNFYDKSFIEDLINAIYVIQYLIQIFIIH